MPTRVHTQATIFDYIPVILAFTSFQGYLSPRKSYMYEACFEK